MTDSQTVKHGLTLLLVNERCEDKTPENLVKSYYEIYDEISEAMDIYNKTHRRKAVVPNRSDIL